MLESVVQEKNVDLLLRFEALTLDQAILSHAEGDVIWKRCLTSSISSTGAICAAITTAENGTCFP